MGLKPVLNPEGVFDDRLVTLKREEERAFQSHLGSKACSLILECLVQRGKTSISPSLELAIRPRHLVVQTKHLGHTIP